MNCRGILRKTSPIKKRNLSTQMVNLGQTIDTVRSIDHNRANSFDDRIDKGINNVASKYEFSSINTTQKTKDKLQHLKNLTAKDATLAELSPRSKVAVAEKALKKLNIQTDRKIYKHLPSVNVNDSVLEVNRLTRRDRKLTSVGLSGIDPEPILKKYLKPANPWEFQLKLRDLDDKFEELTDRQQLANDNFQQLHDVYRKYLHPSRAKNNENA